jgi:hypothetical protein
LVAFVLAFSVHALALAQLVQAVPDGIGGGGKELDAISVTIVASHVLDSRLAPPADKTATAADGDVAPLDGDNAPTPPNPETKEKREEHAPPPEGLAALNKVQPKPEDLPEPPKLPESEHTAEPTPATGGAAARSEQAQQGQNAAAPAAAAPGEVRAYAHLVAAALKKT